MKVISLSQPWASLTMTKSPHGPFALKSWETRGWKPSLQTYRQIKREGLLIHASATWKKPQVELLNQWPFSDYYETLLEFEFGAIIGAVHIGRIWTTDLWLREFALSADKRWHEERQFGDYSAGRFAWEFTEFQPLKTPIPCKGKLSLWDIHYTLDGLKSAFLA